MPQERRFQTLGGLKQKLRLTLSRWGLWGQHPDARQGHWEVIGADPGDRAADKGILKFVSCEAGRWLRSRKACGTGNIMATPVRLEALSVQSYQTKLLERPKLLNCVVQTPLRMRMWIGPESVPWMQQKIH